MSPLCNRSSAGIAITTDAAANGILVITPYLHAVVSTRSVLFLVSSSAALAVSNAKWSSVPSRAYFGGDRKEDTEGTLPVSNQWHLFFGLGSSTGNWGYM